MTMTTTEYDMDAAVAAGAARLDELVSDWRDRIDVDRLDMCSHFNCIVGQLRYDHDVYLPVSDIDAELGFWLPAEHTHIDGGDAEAVRLGFKWAEQIERVAS